MTEVRPQQIENIYFDITKKDSPSKFKSSEYILYNLKSYILIHDKNREYIKTFLIYKWKEKYHKIPVFISEDFFKIPRKSILSFQHVLLPVNFMYDVIIHNQKYKIEIRSLTNMLKHYCKHKSIYLHPKEVNVTPLEESMKNILFNANRIPFFPYIKPLTKIHKAYNLPFKPGDKNSLKSPLISVYKNIISNERLKQNVIIILSNFVVHVPSLMIKDILFIIPYIYKYYNNPKSHLFAIDNEQGLLTEFVEDIKKPTMTRFMFLISLFSIVIMKGEFNVIELYKQLDEFCDNVFNNTDDKNFNLLNEFEITKDELIQSFIWSRLYINIMYGYNVLVSEPKTKDMFYFKQLISTSFDYHPNFKREYFAHLEVFTPYLNSQSTKEYLKDQNESICKYVYREMIDHIFINTEKNKKNKN